MYFVKRRSTAMQKTQQTCEMGIAASRKGKVVGGVEATSLEDVGCGQKYLCKHNMGKVSLSLQYFQ